MVRAGVTAMLRPQYEVCEPWISSSAVVALFLTNLTFLAIEMVPPMRTPPPWPGSYAKYCGLPLVQTLSFPNRLTPSIS
jgi:hypothetical protein